MNRTILGFIGPLHVLGGVLVFATAFMPGLQSTLAEAAGLAGDTYSPFLFAVLGPTIASWGVLFTAVVRQYLEFPSGRLWNYMLAAVLVWAPLDTALCVMFDVKGGIVVNSVMVVVLIILIWSVRIEARN